MPQDKGDSPGAALVRLRWAKTTAAERVEHGRRLARTRWAQVRLLQEAEAALRASQEGNSPPSNPVDPKV
jgi:hypothetical protein